MLDRTFLGNTLENWGISLIIILVTIALVKLISLFNKKVVRKFTKKTANHLDDIIFNAIESPILFGIMLIGLWIAIHRLVYPDTFVNAVDNAYKILIVLTITWIFARLVNGLVEVYWAPKHNPGNGNKMMPVIKRTLLVLVWIIGVVMALSNVGVNIGALLGTLGIGGIAFALAAQDTIKNIFGAFTIFTDKPFNIGDTVRIDGYEGTIIDVGARSTKLMDYDKRIISFPNYKVTDTSIINISSEPMRRVVINIRLSYDTTPEKMNEALGILRGISSKVKFVSPNDLVANFSDLTDTALVITLIYFIEQGGDVLGTPSQVNLEILHAFNKAGIHFYIPTQTVHVEKKENPTEDTKADTQ